MTGTVDVLNCKLGDLKLNFDKDNPVEAERARRAVKQMLRDGYVLFVEVDGKVRRVEDFDEAQDCYLITDVPGVAAAPSVQAAPAEAAAPPKDKPDADRPTDKPAKRGRRGRVPASGTRATGVAPRAGG